MGYNWKPLPVQPIHVEVEGRHMLHLCPAGGRGRLVVIGKVTATYQGTIEEMQQRFTEEMERLCAD